MREFARFAGATAARYKDRVRSYEVWNEPSLAYTFWSRGSETFARLLGEASAAIKAADPDARVMFDVHSLDALALPSATDAGQVSFAVKVLGTLVACSDGQLVRALDTVDIIADHSYPDRTRGIPEDVKKDVHDMATSYARLDAYLRAAYGTPRGVKGYWHTETGWETARWDGRRVSEAKQAALTAWAAGWWGRSSSTTCATTGPTAATRAA